MHAVDMARFATAVPDRRLQHGARDAEALTAPLWSVFGGVQETMLRCSACQSESMSDGELFSCISLAPPTASTTLEALVAELESVEKLTSAGDTCSRCGVGGGLQKQIRIAKWPQVVCFHIRGLPLQRTSGGWLREKVNGRVAFPLVFKGVSGDWSGELAAVCVRAGDGCSGRYAAYAETCSGELVHCDDADVPRSASEAEVQQAQAFFLLYARTDSPSEEQVAERKRRRLASPRGESPDQAQASIAQRGGRAAGSSFGRSSGTSARSVKESDESEHVLRSADRGVAPEAGRRNAATNGGADRLVSRPTSQDKTYPVEGASTAERTTLPGDVGAGRGGDADSARRGMPEDGRRGASAAARGAPGVHGRGASNAGEAGTAGVGGEQTEGAEKQKRGQMEAQRACSETEGVSQGRVGGMGAAGPATAAAADGGSPGDAVGREAAGHIETPVADEAQEWFFAARVDPHSQDPRRNREKAVAEAAALLRECPGAPGDPEDPSVPWGDALAEDRAVELPAAHCAFRGCRWAGDAEAALIEHVATGHGDVLQPIADTTPKEPAEQQKVASAPAGYGYGASKAFSDDGEGSRTTNKALAQRIE
ncbi:unnamed protein product [Prorocentrum cordatum]|uniref:USP domain-containing protein n=1 Tax=Prorocentrum cordatum TaxID=2364126 RepID=A0ABN9RID0_9DINO|nr:unnamed protein product [Polarella glacialis]